MRNVTTAGPVKPEVRVGRDEAASSTPASAPFAAMAAILFVYLAIDYIRPHDLIPPLAALRSGLILSLILIPFSLSQIRHPVFQDKGVRCYMLFVALGAFSIVYAVNTFWVYEYSKLLTQFLLTVVVPIGVLIVTMGRLRKLVALWIGVHTFLGIYAMTHGGLGPGGFLEDENDLSLALITALPYAYFLQRSPSLPRSLRLVLLAAFIIMVSGVIATMSRGGFVGLIVTTFALVMWSRNRIRNALVICVLAALVFIFLPDRYRSEMETISNVSDETRVERLISWEIGWRMFLDNPVLGVAVGNYPWRVEDYQEEGDYSRGLGGRAAHSLYFTLVPETGLVGTLLFGMIVVHIVRQQRRSVRLSRGAQPGEDAEFIEASARATIVALFGFLATSTFISVLYFPQFWYLIGFSYAVHRNAQGLAPAKPS